MCNDGFTIEYFWSKKIKLTAICKWAWDNVFFQHVWLGDASIKYTFAWDRRNAYRQKVYGIVNALVSVGYEYRDCREIFWETKTTTLAGYDMTSSEIGGWNLHMHHKYHFQEGDLNTMERVVIDVINTRCSYGSVKKTSA